ncbi:hypothetical protein PTI45_01121 [Paenibacillus nuruki]|uniref:Uncharacterized protein n=1 Tax=Paenibacillus nuruki TaxID=1886670 RepID=A0A1E3L7A8_9BACL|nr:MULTISPECIES: hypothetical protein [Paenibacillus]ODP29638.1 hypothetical protein PTI45_01121 [Paenibacillus nuruki]TKJ89868.1 hypothetical protein PaeCFBP13512_14720 [Paenibacillus sp. CFBP13512]CAJ1317453.1 Pullulanase [Paenibacillus nuruki]
MVTQALIEWNIDPTSLPQQKWLTDQQLNLDLSHTKVDLTEEGWTIQIRITESLPDSWDTYAEVQFLTDPDDPLEEGFTFLLWAGSYVADVTIVGITH